MAMYEYECETCDLVVEELRDVDKRDDPLDCPECSKPLKRAFTTTSYMCVKDNKLWTNTHDGRTVRKSRRRVLGTDIGRVRVDKMGNELNALHEQYKKL